MKYVKCSELVCCLILVNSGLARVLLTPRCASAIILVPNTLPRSDSFSIAMLSWSSKKRGALGQLWDICQVLLKNFDLLPITPLWLPYPVVQG
jgi:hypothetical protein